MNHLPRRTIGFLTANVHMGAARVLWPGVLDAAEAGEVNLICYPGGRLHASEEFEEQRNVVYRLVNPDRLDGLVVWASAIAGAGTSIELSELRHSFDTLPIVSLATQAGPGPLFSIDSYQGMRALVFHLIDVHKYRRIVLIRGPEGHPHAEERHEAYLDALKERGIEADPALITPCTNWEQGGEAMRLLLQDRRLKPRVDFEAVVSASDILAIGALAVLAEAGIRVPEDIAVVGFNDIEEGRLVRPPLTSVSLPFYEQGHRSVEALLATLDGNQVPDHVVLHSRLLVRQSCGCPSWSVDLAGAEPLEGQDKDTARAFKRAQDQVVEQIARVISSRGVAATWAKQLIDAARGDIFSPDRGRFRATLDGMLQQGTLDGDETAAWQATVSILRRELLHTLDPDTMLRAEDLFGQARVVIGEAIQRARNARQLQSDRRTRVLRDISQALITAFDMQNLSDILAERLPALGIQSCFVTQYQAPLESLDTVRLVSAFVEGARVDLSPDSPWYPARDLVPPALLPRRRHALLVEPLYFRTEPLGFVVCEIGPRDGAIYEVLRGHVSSALKGAMLFQEASEARLAAERADQIKTRLLANVSHELRTPLNIILGHTQRLLDSPPDVFARDLEDIQQSAEHQLRLINDLLDLSRAEINALDLYQTALDPTELIREAFGAMSEDQAEARSVTWRLEIPERLGMIEADPVRLRQILLNLLSNASKFTERGEITLGAEMAPPHLHIWVSDTGPGIEPALIDRIFEPFPPRSLGDRSAGGIGLGLSITKHLVALHGGFLAVDSRPGEGSTFHVYLPLAAETRTGEGRPPPVGSILWLISDVEDVPEDILGFCDRQHLNVLRLRPKDDLESMLRDRLPRMVAWDVANTNPEAWSLISRLHNHPRLAETPFILFHQGAVDGGSTGMTSLAVKRASSHALWEAIRPSAPKERTGSVLIIDDDPNARRALREAVSRGLSGYEIRLAEGGRAGLESAQAEPPSLVVLDLMMPDMDGFEVLDHMRADDRTRHVPVVVLSARQLSLGDVERLERHASVKLQSKGMLSEDEIVASLNRAIFGAEALPAHTGALAKRAIAYFHQNYTRPLTRWEVAEEIGVSEDYMSHVFTRELGISPWDYLNRYRVSRARELLRTTQNTISQIASAVGFTDPAYFSRVFRRITSTSPSAYRKHPDR